LTARLAGAENQPGLIYGRGDAVEMVGTRVHLARLWTCDAGRAGTRLRLEALHQSLTIGRPAADRAGARPYQRLS
jgi:hypothetical protein